jgi:DNA-binding SARP family transcriptional activator
VTLEQQGSTGEAIDLYLRAIEADPLTEDIYRCLMSCYASEGRRAEAIESYRRCRQMLSVVLGVAPSAETEALRRVISNTDAPD